MAEIIAGKEQQKPFWTKIGDAAHFVLDRLTLEGGWADMPGGEGVLNAPGDRHAEFKGRLHSAVGQVLVEGPQVAA